MRMSGIRTVSAKEYDALQRARKEGAKQEQERILKILKEKLKFLHFEAIEKEIKGA
jgi:hypothetical protein